MTAPSCAGKSFLLDHLDSTEMYSKIPTYTTRVKRAGEVHGVDYFFVDEKEFNVLRGLHGGFIEDIEFNGGRYGMPAGFFEERINTDDKIPVIICTPDGVRIYEKYAADNDLIHVKVFVFTEEKTRLNRLINRTFKAVHASSSEDEIKNVIFSNINRCRDIYVKECNWFGQFKWDVVVSGERGVDVAEAMISKKIEQLKKLYMS